MALTETDVKTGMGGMLLEIWQLQKQIKELQTELEQLKPIPAEGPKKKGRYDNTE